MPAFDHRAGLAVCTGTTMGTASLSPDQHHDNDGSTRQMNSTINPCGKDHNDAPCPACIEKLVMHEKTFCTEPKCLTPMNCFRSGRCLLDSETAPRAVILPRTVDQWCKFVEADDWRQEINIETGRKRYRATDNDKWIYGEPPAPWRPMNTVPDLQAVLVATAITETFVFDVAIYNRVRNRWFTSTGKKLTVGFKPTYWQPIEAPPSKYSLP